MSMAATGKLSKYIGVTRNRSSRVLPWRAQIKHKGTIRCLGYFADERSAALAFDQAARHLRGMGARVNFPEIVTAPDADILRAICAAPKIAKTGGGCRAGRNETVAKWLPLVYKIAHRKRLHYGPLSVEDLVQEGTIGLMRAVDKLDPAKEFAFLKYATKWIVQFMNEAIQRQTRWIYLPEHAVRLLRQYDQRFLELANTRGFPPKAEEVVDLMDIDSEARSMLWDALHSQRPVRRDKEDEKGRGWLETIPAQDWDESS